jgi:hypothetical protein
LIESQASGIFTAEKAIPIKLPTLADLLANLTRFEPAFTTEAASPITGNPPKADVPQSRTLSQDHPSLFLSRKRAAFKAKAVPEIASGSTKAPISFITAHSSFPVASSNPKFDKSDKFNEP